MKLENILFRALTIKNKWIFGYLIKQGAYYFIQNDKGGNEVVLQNTICQFSGVLDKNGEKIFNNDIISFGKDYKSDLIEFETGSFGYKNDTEIEYFTPLIENDSSYYEVIGNIYENPELLTN